MKVTIELLARIFRKSGERVELEYRFAPPRRWRFDLAIPARMIALEVEGGAWNYGRHNRASGFVKDLEKYSEAAVLGWRVIRVTPQQLEDGSAVDYLDRALGKKNGAAPAEAAPKAGDIGKESTTFP